MGKRGPKPWEPTDEQARLVEQMAAVGIAHEQIAAVIGISQDTLAERCGEILKTAGAKANARVAGKLYQTAVSGNVTAMIFWLKTRAGWREVVQQEITGANGKDIVPVLNITIAPRPDGNPDKR